MKQNLIFPLAGFGNRFKDAGHIQTKPLIHAGNKTIIEWAMEAVKFAPNTRVIFIVRKDQCIINGLDSYIKQRCPNAEIIKLDGPTNGSLETVAIGIEGLSLEGALHINTSDIVLPDPVCLDSIFNNNDMEASSVTFKANNPSYSYCKINDNDPNLVEYMVEKEIISQIANVGIYSFRSVNKFIEYTNEILISNTRVKNEFYISSVFDLYIRDKKKIQSLQVSDVHIIGTPSELSFFTKFVLPTMNPKSIGFVSDHSGFYFKDKLINLFKKENFKTVDYGCFSDMNCDYSDYVPIACRGLRDSEVDIIIGSCKSGQGVNICANHQKNIISVAPQDKNQFKYARKHNCPNFITLPSNFWTPEDAFKIYKNVFKTIHFEGGRHSTRIQKMLFSNNI